MSSIGTNLIFNILRNIANIIFPLITAPYIARILDPNSLGLANFANTYASYFILVAALGIPNYGIREIAKNRDDKNKLSQTFSELFSINILTTLCSSILFIASILVIHQLNADYLIFLIAGISLFTSPFSIDWFFLGVEDVQYITIRSLFIKIICIICLFLFVKDNNDLIIYVLINVLYGTLSQIWNFIVLYKKGIKIKIVRTGYKKHLKPLLLLFSSMIAVSLYTTINVVMLGFLSTYNQVSFYNQANNIARAFLAIVTSFSEIMVPRISYYSKDINWNMISNLINKSFAIVSFIAIPIALGIIIIAPILIPLFLGPNFYGSIRPLQIMSLITVIIGFNNITTVQILLSMGHDYMLLKSVLWGAGTNILLNIFLIPWIGAEGASISSVLAEVVILIVSYVFVRKVAQIRFIIIQNIVKSCIGTILFIPLFFILNSFFDNWLLIAFYAVSCILIYIISQFFLKNEAFYMIFHYLQTKIRIK